VDIGGWLDVEVERSALVELEVFRICTLSVEGIPVLLVVVCVRLHLEIGKRETTGFVEVYNDGIRKELFGGGIVKSARTIMAVTASDIRSHRRQRKQYKRK
jgi:hypothetical protein